MNGRAMGRLSVWTGIDAWRAEVAAFDLTAGGIRAAGTQLGIEPLPYRLDYGLDAPERFVTRGLEAEATGEGWSRRLRLLHDADGRWLVEAAQEGTVDLPPAGGDAAALDGALDCDLGLSPLTNLMPIRRHGLHQRPGRIDLLVAWVSVPDLGVHPSRQRYEHVRAGGAGAVVRYVDLGTHQGFVAELELDAEGLVVVYPGLARRVGHGQAGIT
jgi:uncharacterized protein